MFGSNDSKTTKKFGRVSRHLLWWDFYIVCWLKWKHIRQTGNCLLLLMDIAFSCDVLSHRLCLVDFLGFISIPSPANMVWPIYIYVSSSIHNIYIYTHTRTYTYRIFWISSYPSLETGNSIYCCILHILLIHEPEKNGSFCHLPRNRANPWYLDPKNNRYKWMFIPRFD